MKVTITATELILLASMVMIMGLVSLIVIKAVFVTEIPFLAV